MKEHSELWKQAEENAKETIKKGLPYSMFLCCVDNKYKAIIWNKQMALLNGEPILFNN